MQGREPHTSYDLIIVGAGIAGLTALHAAAVQLGRGARVLLIDAKDAPGGMWNHTYDYVRLHQPHAFFSPGALPWGLGQPGHYLPRGDEVQAHLATCLDQIGELLTLETQFGHVASDIREVDTEDVWAAEVDVHPTGVPGAMRTVTARRVIDAAGFDHAPLGPLELSSGQVHAATPESLGPALAAHPAAPAYVVGGGKTGMDTILAIAADNPQRRIVLINGGGTYFMSRDRLFPTGLRRWFGGTVSITMLRDCVMRFDGRNEDAVRAHFQSHYAAPHDSRAKSFVWGVQSGDEAQRVAAALSETVWDYLEDITDGPDGPQMHLRGGATRAIEPGSLVVNCKSSLVLAADDTPARPVLSPHDVILSIGTRQAIHLLTSVSSFVLSNLFLTGQMRDAGLYFVDLDALLAKDKAAFSATTFLLAYYNALMGLRPLSPEARAGFGFDTNNWFPAPRRLLALNAIRKTAREDLKHCRKSLDVVMERFGIAGGLLALMED
ncbi:MAG: NAD(P)-binding protein [Pseudomonadota bacterium]